MALRRLYIDISQPPGTALVESDKSRNQAPVMHFTQGDVESVQLCLLEPNPSGGLSAPYTKINLNGYAIRLTIGAPGGTPATTVTSWSVASPYTAATANLQLNTVGITSLVGSNAEVNSKLHIRFDPGSGNYETKVLANCVVHRTVDNGVTEEPTPVDGFYTKFETDAKFAAKTMPAGEALILTSPDGLAQVRLYVDNNGDFHADPIS